MEVPATAAVLAGPIPTRRDVHNSPPARSQTERDGRGIKKGETL